MNFVLRILVFVVALKTSTTAPSSKARGRQNKALYFDYLQPDENIYDAENDDDYVSMALEQNDLSRTIPSTRRKTERPRPLAAPTQSSFNSPIYYIRLPPQPYVFVPGLGYMSQPNPTPVSQLLNLPVNFVSNGKPSGIYQWSSGYDSFPTAEPPTPPPTRRPKPTKTKPTDSTIHRLPGKYTFNGKPNDIFVLRDSYNSLYSDVLQNFYP